MFGVSRYNNWGSLFQYFNYWLPRNYFQIQSYAEQIINFTFPHVGNVGTNKEDHESDKIWTKGVIINTEITDPSNYRSSNI